MSGLDDGDFVSGSESDSGSSGEEEEGDFIESEAEETDREFSSSSSSSDEEEEEEDVNQGFSHDERERYKSFLIIFLKASTKSLRKHLKETADRLMLLTLMIAVFSLLITHDVCL